MLVWRGSVGLVCGGRYCHCSQAGLEWLKAGGFSDFYWEAGPYDWSSVEEWGLQIISVLLYWIWTEISWILLDLQGGDPSMEHWGRPLAHVWSCMWMLLWPSSALFLNFLENHTLWPPALVSWRNWSSFKRSSSVFEYNRRLYSLGGLAGNDRGFDHSICASRGYAASKRHWANM